MANTYTLIASSTVGAGGASSIDFTSIPSTYTDLQVVISIRGGGSYELWGTINSSSSGYTNRFLSGTGSATASGTYQTAVLYLGEVEYSTQTASTFSNHSIYIPNYANTSYAKTLSTESVQENNATASYAYMVASLWNNTSAITSFTVKPSSGTFVQYSSAYLYGIKKS